MKVMQILDILHFCRRTYFIVLIIVCFTLAEKARTETMLSQARVRNPRQPVMRCLLKSPFWGQSGRVHVAGKRTLVTQSRSPLLTTSSTHREPHGRLQFAHRLGVQPQSILLHSSSTWNRLGLNRLTLCRNASHDQYSKFGHGRQPKVTKWAYLYYVFLVGGIVLCLGVDW